MTEPPGNLLEAGDAPASAASGTIGPYTINDTQLRAKLKTPARSDAPRTSHDAARHIEGYAPIQRARVYSFIESRGSHGATDAEVQTAHGLGPQSVSPRRGELVALGRVRDSGARRPTPSGRKATVWVACVPPADGVGIGRGQAMKRRTGDPPPTGGMDRFAQSRAIQNARGLSIAEKLVLYTLWNYADEAGECWPSLKSIARDAGLRERSAGKVLARLRDRGIVQTIENPKGRACAGGRGNTTTRRINYAQLRALADSPADSGSPNPERTNPVPTPGFHHDAGATETSALSVGTPGPECANSVPERTNPVPKTDEQTIEPTIEQTRRTDHRDRSDSAARDDGWMPEPGAPDPNASTEPIVETTYHALAACGIRGPNRDRLAAAPGLTAAIVWDEHRDLKTDTNVRNRPAVLVRRLSERFGVLSMKQNGATLAPNELDVMKRIEHMQRTKRAQ